MFFVYSSQKVMLFLLVVSFLQCCGCFSPGKSGQNIETEINEDASSLSVDKNIKENERDLHEKSIPKVLAGSSDRKGLVEWIRIDGGVFQMGNNVGDLDEMPVHEVSVKEFDVTKTEITVEQYMMCVRSGICSVPCGAKDNIRYCNWNHGEKGDYPVNCIDWNQATVVCSWLGGRLPSEAEWEYAARSEGKSQIYPWGNEIINCERAIWGDEGKTLGCGRDISWPVCSKMGGNTAQGVCDMTGNVWEWTADVYHKNYNGAPNNGTAWEEHGDVSTEKRRVLRGNSAYGKDPSLFRVTARFGNIPTVCLDSVGVRCVR